MISTHTPLAGRDCFLRIAIICMSEFLLTRPSRGVTAVRRHPSYFLIFLLTRPSRGVTLFFAFISHPNLFLLTRPSRGVTRPVYGFGNPLQNFYSHAPRGA